MHVILRYEIERDVISGKAQVSDIPDRWNEGMKRHLRLDTVGNFKDKPTRHSLADGSGRLLVLHIGCT